MINGSKAAAGGRKNQADDKYVSGSSLIDLIAHAPNLLKHGDIILPTARLGFSRSQTKVSVLEKTSLAVGKMVNSVIILNAHFQGWLDVLPYGVAEQYTTTQQRTFKKLFCPAESITAHN